MADDKTKPRRQPVPSKPPAPGRDGIGKRDRVFPARDSEPLTEVSRTHPPPPPPEKK